MATIWITGASGAVGSALARRLSMRGLNVVLTSRDEGRLAELAGELGEHAFAAPADATDAAQVQSAIQAGNQRFGEVTGVAHCVGSILIRPLHLTSEADMRATLEQNYVSAWHVLRAFVTAALAHRKPASAVLVGTVAAKSGFPNHEAIAGAKGAVAALAVTAAATYADRGIRVNCVHPGLTVSSMSSKLTGTAESIARMSKLNPMRRLGQGEDAAALIDFLLGDDATWITGQQIGVDGGHGILHSMAGA
ncbi:SDR family oxidoreductase [Paraburkholderia bryophila]|uniref:SDR family NAD(P)-dependent oxidoreductase n=1 Tax=Paraburkholderia bryophila TaxID=420952 RepID=UPI00234974CD|nr:SDR family oxidoreductase [Paraburkholderia bryophila]WCM18291.1 SDR family oxidoreductase [Paraburkholderia bryophila]